MRRLDAGEERARSWSCCRAPRSRWRDRCRAAIAAGVAFVPRGAGTGLSGGCLPVDAPVMIGTSRMNRIVEVDVANRRVVVEARRGQSARHQRGQAAGLLLRARPVEPDRLHDRRQHRRELRRPAHAEVRRHHQSRARRRAGAARWRGGASSAAPAEDDAGLRPDRRWSVGSEGTFGIVTRATLRLVRAAGGVQDDARRLRVASTTRPPRCRGIIAAGIIPAALEMMDQLIIGAVEAAFHFGFPTDAGAVLIVELDGLAAGLDRAGAARSPRSAARNRRARRAAGADEAERAALWKSRKRAFGAVGRLAPNYCTQDGVVPRTKAARHPAPHRRHRGSATSCASATSSTPATATSIRSCCSTSATPTRSGACSRPGARSSKPASSWAAASPASMASASRRSRRCRCCSPDDLRVMSQLRRVFDPANRCNPGKIFPQPGACVEVAAPRRQVPL